MPPAWPRALAPAAFLAMSAARAHAAAADDESAPASAAPARAATAAVVGAGPERWLYLRCTFARRLAYHLIDFAILAGAAVIAVAAGAFRLYSSSGSLQSAAPVVVGILVLGYVAVGMLDRGQRSVGMRVCAVDIVCSQAPAGASTPLPSAGLLRLSLRRLANFVLNVTGVGGLANSLLLWRTHRSFGDWIAGTWLYAVRPAL